MVVAEKIIPRSQTGADLRAPFPWFGGKSRAAALVWERFGRVDCYVEPFAGSLAVLLERPAGSFSVKSREAEIVNDADGNVANFWRAVKGDSDAVAAAADWPTNEVDLQARHARIRETNEERVERLLSDPDYYDPKIAGWWAWGLAVWIGGGWGSTGGRRMPRLGRPCGMAVPRYDVRGWLRRLSDRLRWVRVCCGDWSRVVTDAVFCHYRTRAVFLDPPYSAEADRAANTYAVEDYDVAHVARQWAIDHGDDPSFRIALCGFSTEHDFPDGWECVGWKGLGSMGRGAANKGNENAKRERVWFSPHCASARQATLF